MRIFLSTKTAAKYAPEDIYMEFATTEQERQQQFDQTRFQLKILRSLVIGQQPFSEAESEALKLPLRTVVRRRSSNHAQGTIAFFFKSWSLRARS
jgi:hypothetical protein